jgi:hypothetical protein
LWDIQKQSIYQKHKIWTLQPKSQTKIKLLKFVSSRVNCSITPKIIPCMYHQQSINICQSAGNHSLSSYVFDSSCAIIIQSAQSNMMIVFWLRLRILDIRAIFSFPRIFGKFEFTIGNSVIIYCRNALY